MNRLANHGCLSLVLLSTAPAALGQEDRIENYTFSPSGTEVLNRRLGSVFAAGADHLVCRLKDPADGSDGGTLAFMRRNSFGNWSQNDEVNGSSVAGSDIAIEVALDGNHAVATSMVPGSDPVVTLYTYDSAFDNWTQAPRVLGRPGTITASFGSSLAIDGDLVAVGDPDAGLAHVYRIRNGGIDLIGSLASPGPAPVEFGHAVGLDGPWLAVGDPGDDDGRVDLFYVNEFDGISTQGPVEPPFELRTGDRFGAELDLDGGALAIGAPRFGLNAGLIFIYDRIGEGVTAVWDHAIDAEAVDGLGRFPSSIDVEDGVVVAGAPGLLFSGESGAAMVFRRSSNDVVPAFWTNSETLRYSDPAGGFDLGMDVALCGIEALVGIPGLDLGGFPPQQVGGINSYLMDCDFDGVPDVLEIIQGTEVDYDLDGVPDYCELDEFVLVPLDFATIQSAVDDGGGRVVLLQPGTFTEAVSIEFGQDADIRAFEPWNPPVWNTSGGTAVTLVSGSSMVRLEHLEFRGNSSAVAVPSGLVEAGSSFLTVLDCSFIENLDRAVSLSNCEFYAYRSRFEGNVTTSDGGAAIYGTNARLNLEDCVFLGNGGNVPVDFVAHRGGAIRLEDAAGNGIAATRCTFSGNQALVRHEQVTSGGNGTAAGGAVSIGSLDQSSFFSECVFEDNLADASLERFFTSYASNSAAGGAIDARIGSAELNIVDCTFERNESRALDTQGGTGFATSASIFVSGFAGSDVDLVDGIISDSNCTIALLDGTIEEVGRTVADSVTLYSVDTAAVVRCDFIRSGHLYCASFGFAEMSILVNQSRFLDSGLVNLQKPSTVISSQFDGTRLLVNGDVIGSSFERIQTTGSAVDFLSITEGPSLIGSDFHRIAGASVVGGGSETEPIAVSGTTICGNSAVPFESDLYWTNGGGNTIENGPNGTTPCPSGSTISVPGSVETIEDALLLANNGDTVLIGAGIWNETVDLRGFAGIELLGAGADDTVIAPPTGQAGILVDGGSLVVRDLAVTQATTGVLVESGRLLMTDVVITDCVAECGGALRLGEGSPVVESDGGYVLLGNVQIVGNTASGNGGGICVGPDASLVVEGGRIDSNTAGIDGGGLHVSDGALQVVLRDTLLESNGAVRDGGGIHADSAAILQLLGMDVAANDAGRFGGGAAVDAAEIVGCSFVGNTAGEVGGGLRSTGTSQLRSCSFQLNVAGVGGGLAATATPTYVLGFTACGNVGGDWYGDLREFDGNPLFCSIDCNGNGVPDADEIAGGLLEDCNGNTIPDVCEDLSDVDGNGIPDECDPTTGGEVLVGLIDTVEGLPGTATTLLARPLFRSGQWTHDILVLDPTGDGSLSRVRQGDLGGYEFGGLMVGADFLRCCYSKYGVPPECLNNGPSGGAKLAFARGDVIITHPTGDTGLFDESLEMYYACDAPAGAGQPAPITDYDLGPDTTIAVTAEYVEEEEEGGLAASGLSVKSSGQVLVAAPTSSDDTKPTSSRRGSGQGGTGPYPGVDAVSDEGLSVLALATGRFDDDENDDLVTLHPAENGFTIRYFTGAPDVLDPLSGEFVPSGATWSEPFFQSTTDPGRDLVVGDFVDLLGTADDGLADVAVVVDTPDGDVVRLWASTGSGGLAQVGDDYVLPSDNWQLGITRLDSSGQQAILVAVQDIDGQAYLDHITWDPVAANIRYGWIGLGNGSILGVSTAPVRKGVSSREVVAVLLDLGATTSVALLELGSRPAHPSPDNDDCAAATVVAKGTTSFTTLGAETDGDPLPGACLSDGVQQISNDVWFEWTATCSGAVEVSTCGTADFDTWLAVYDGACNGAVLACNDQDVACAGNTSRLEFPAVAGATYLIRIGSWSVTGSGSGQLTIGCPGSPADLNGDGVVDGADLTQLLGNWGQPGPSDINGDGVTDGADLSQLLGEWGS